jgi:hypothetical protein
MIHSEFHIILAAIVKEIYQRLDAKNKEYASNDDKLHNFKRAALIDGITSIEALRGMELKHLTSLRDMLDGLKEGKTYPLIVWWEKTIDEINYLILLYALLVEKYNVQGLHGRCTQRNGM